MLYNLNFNLSRENIFYDLNNVLSFSRDFIKHKSKRAPEILKMYENVIIL